MGVRAGTHVPWSDCGGWSGVLGAQTKLCDAANHNERGIEQRSVARHCRHCHDARTDKALGRNRRQVEWVVGDADVVVGSVRVLQDESDVGDDEHVHQLTNELAWDLHCHVVDGVPGVVRITQIPQKMHEIVSRLSVSLITQKKSCHFSCRSPAEQEYAHGHVPIDYVEG